MSANQNTGDKAAAQGNSWMGSISNAASGVAGTAGGVVGGAVGTVGGAVGNVGRGLGKTLSDASTSIEQTSKGVSDQVHESTGAKQQGKAETK